LLGRLAAVHAAAFGQLALELDALLGRIVEAVQHELLVGKLQQCTGRISAPVCGRAGKGAGGCGRGGAGLGERGLANRSFGHSHLLCFPLALGFGLELPMLLLLLPDLTSLDGRVLR
jgi:hypothetical protein